jgi:hypothetical protein
VHEFGTIHETLLPIRTCNKGKLMTCWESYFMQCCRQQGLLIDEQTVNEPNPLYNLLIDKHLSSPPSSLTPRYLLDTCIPPLLSPVLPTLQP